MNLKSLEFNMEISLFLIIICISTFATSNPPRIFDGHKGYIMDHPWLVSIYTKSYLNLTCAGALIAPLWVVTVGHVLRNEYSPYFIRAGTGNTINGGSVSEVIEVFHPPDYEAVNSLQSYHDIALLRLVVPINEGYFIQYARLPNPKSEVNLHTELLLTGWKLAKCDIQEKDTVRNYHIKEIPVVVLDLRQCRSSYRCSEYSVTSDMICVDHFAKTCRPETVELCTGYTGGPAVTNKTLFGLISFGTTTKTEIYPTVLTKVSAFVTWIRFLMDIDPLLFPPFR